MTNKITVQLEYMPGTLLSTGDRLPGAWAATAEANGVKIHASEVDAHAAASGAVRGLLELFDEGDSP